LPDDESKQFVLGWQISRASITTGQLPLSIRSGQEAWGDRRGILLSICFVGVGSGELASHFHEMPQKATKIS
jgi:hypothetical protein